ncbi:amino acid ABC transporter substrate-binding protein (PAAT family) [Breoghania corrubedonensis]|uniref:Amino acid ABC transporter substrate-binding protein (PAAT family) n=1 Tax=Breoghania corrubedonensis TaxID=665038 RepID=A0A2T5VFQ5_9HYPH|nr:transporter substrate-binding domain-containing protein [Breoghania corrubedonensis]PTW62579.1 amino acid ABC transporter substrate-binding protein (PAAT family) [Breoghania corrubedonensis]
MNLLKSLCTVAGVALMAFSAQSATAKSLDDILSGGTITVGINPNLPPLGQYNDKNEIEGFDVDVAHKLGELLGVDVKFVEVTSADRVPFLATGKADIVLGALTRTPARAKVIDFTLPIQTEALSALTLADKPFKSLADLNSADVKLIEVRGTTPVEFVKTHLPDAKVMLFDNYPDAVKALFQGRGDAIVDVVDYIGKYTANYDKKTKVLSDPSASVDYDCIGIAQGNTALKSWLNTAIYSLQTSGFMDESYKKWFGMDMVYKIPAQPYF